MKRAICSLFTCAGLVAAMLMIGGTTEAQNPKGKPRYGSVTLKTGFEPDPYEKKLEAGGDIVTDKGGVKAHVAKQPDFILNYEAGDKFPLIIHAKSKADTTLLVFTPDGKWVANDDRSKDDLNPLIKFDNPKSGRYVIWVGTFAEETAKATLYITELDAK